MVNRTVEFDMSQEDTCMKRWVFNLKQDSGEPVIESVEIERERQGCVGHPKTISALVRNVPVNALDVEALSQTQCARSTSCGMVLASCVSAIQEGNA